MFYASHELSNIFFWKRSCQIYCLYVPVVLHLVNDRCFLVSLGQESGKQAALGWRMSSRQDYSYMPILPFSVQLDNFFDVLDIMNISLAEELELVL